MDQTKTELVEAVVRFISYGNSSYVIKGKSLREEEDSAITKSVQAKHGDVEHVASEGSHHIYAQGAGHGIKYLHHDSSTGKTIKLGTHGRRATESSWTDMRMKLETHGHNISDKTDEKIRDFHDGNM